jgi:sensor domain CHASE-containing protein
MKPQLLETQPNNNLSPEQLRTFSKFQRKLKEKVPDYQIAWVHPIKENMIEVGLESKNKMTYRKTRQAVNLALEVEDKTGVFIILL